MEHGEVTDRQLEALLGRLDRIAEELQRMNRRESSHVATVSSFGQGANGDLYAVSLGGGLYKLTG